MRGSQLFDFLAFFDCFVTDVDDEAEDEEDAEEDAADDSDDDSIVLDTVDLPKDRLRVCTSTTCLMTINLLELLLEFLWFNRC